MNTIVTPDSYVYTYNNMILVKYMFRDIPPDDNITEGMSLN